ncbi:poly(U) specific endoribonuclease [Trichuris trichiura]|uniref:Poly(U) specific endoribonuclease n=1 Tax=Trichuris trichiura TaxID=36087 RepID=A0A077ZHM0_TRITR|nr:poly(U) specific endoribonuclease [Trichuris trichiura]
MCFYDWNSYDKPDYYINIQELENVHSEWYSQYPLTPEDLAYMEEYTMAERVSAVTDEEIDELVKKMRQADINRASKEDIKLNYQNLTTMEEDIDKAPKPLFARINQSLFHSPTYAALINLHNVFNRMEEASERLDDEDRIKIETFLDAVAETDVYQLMKSFLQKKGLMPKRTPRFNKVFFKMWFKLYDSDDAKKSSSGFEHVFLGEWKTPLNASLPAIVDGMHNWVRYFLLEKTGEINYKGYIEKVDNLLVTIKYDWGKYKKAIGSFLVGTSPEFEISLYTLCMLAKPNIGNCRFHIDGQTMYVLSFKFRDDPAVITTYPTLPE